MNIETPEGLAQAVAWQTMTLSFIKSGGAWMVPRSMQVIQIFHDEKMAVFVEGQRGINIEPDIVKVFTAMGWRCVTSESFRAALAVLDVDEDAKEFIDKEAFSE